MTPPGHLWHPYTRFSFLDEGPLPVVTGADGSWLELEDGRRVFDGISSWWCMNLGHRRPELLEAMARQAGVLDHSILGHLSHPPAARLAERLAGLMPSPDRRVMFGSDGSAAVEAALKIAVQYFANIGQPERNTFVTLRDPYHGDTLGAVSAGYMEGFHRPFKPLLFQTHPAPPPGTGAEGESMASVLARLRGRVAGVLVEPLLQGAAGMRMYPPESLRAIAGLCREAGALLICDEIATGFYRTGTRFAFEQAGVDPDLVLLGKGLTGGVFPLSAAVVRSSIYETFSDTPADHTFYHGHTYTGHPVGCAVALAALDTYDRLGMEALVRRGGDILREAMALPLSRRDDIRAPRTLGLVSAADFKTFDPARMARIRRACLRDGLFIRPLGPTVYLFPPLTTPEEELRHACALLLRAIEDE